MRSELDLRFGRDVSPFLDCFRRFLDENLIGKRRIAGPLLLLQGEADGAMPDMLDWVADRFAGEPIASNCDVVP